MGQNKDTYKTDSTIKLIRDIWHLIEGRRTRFFVASFFELVSNLAWLYPAYALALVVNFLTNYSAGQPLTELKWIAILWIIASVVHYCGREIAYYIGFQLSERTSLDAQFRTMDHLLLLDLTWHEKENSGKKLKRIQKGGEGIDTVIRIWFDHIIQIVVNFLGNSNRCEFLRYGFHNRHIRFSSCRMDTGVSCNLLHHILLLHQVRRKFGSHC